MQTVTLKEWQPFSKTGVKLSHAAEPQEWYGQSWFDFAAEQYMKQISPCPLDVAIATRYTIAYAYHCRTVGNLPNPPLSDVPTEYLSIFRYSLKRLHKKRQARLNRKALLN